ncbi:MAG: GIY-YIG nuclease family protein [Planctomycetota bacterium]
MFWVYVLRSLKTGRRYVGSSDNVDRRLVEHNTGQSKSTRHGIPWKVIYTEACKDRSEAVRRERYFKTGRGREDLDRMLG